MAKFGKAKKWCIAMLAFATTTTIASENELIIVAERSQGLVPSASLDDNRLSKNETVELQARGRIWAVKEDPSDAYNLICMNQRSTPLSLTYKLTDRPWLSIANGERCEMAKANVYVCNDAVPNPPALMCRTKAIAENRRSSGLTDMTAVALRSINTSDESFLQVANNIMGEHQIHIELCQDIHGIHKNGGIAFTVQANGEVNNARVITNGELATPQTARAFGECVAQAINIWQFPELDYIYDMEYAFADVTE